MHADPAATPRANSEETQIGLNGQGHLRRRLLPKSRLRKSLELTSNSLVKEIDHPFLENRQRRSRSQRPGQHADPMHG